MSPTHVRFVCIDILHGKSQLVCKHGFVQESLVLQCVHSRNEEVNNWLSISLKASLSVERDRIFKGNKTHVCH